MIKAIAIANYRSLKDVVLPLKQLTVITGANGSGKTNLYKSLKLLSETSINNAISCLALEGGINSVLWAGPEGTTKGFPIQGEARKNPIQLKLGFASDQFSYSIEFGLPKQFGGSAFNNDAEIKREVIWHGEVWRPSAALMDRKNSLVFALNDNGVSQPLPIELAPYDSILNGLADPTKQPEAFILRDQIRFWRFYDHFRTDEFSAVRNSSIGTRTPILHHDGRDLASALQTIIEIGDAEGLANAIDNAFPKSTMVIQNNDGIFNISFKEYGLLRSLSQSELSAGTLKYLLWVAALLTPRPPALMVLNEPETNLHPDLIPALVELILEASHNSQVWVVTHSLLLAQMLGEHQDCAFINLVKENGETKIENQTEFEKKTIWNWPPR